ncbi:MAG: hypothetical protein ACM3ZC_07005 [Bacteroidota bacterium]
MARGTGKTDPEKSGVSFVMTADDAERYAPPAEIDPKENLQEKGAHGRGHDTANLSTPKRRKE